MKNKSIKEKSPAFQFYPKDFLTDGKAMMMPNEVLGIYVRLLCFDWVDDGLPEDSSLWRRLVAFEEPPHDIGYGLTWEQVVSWVEHMFNKHPNKAGYVTNPRLQIEREGQAERREKRAEAGRESGRIRKSQANSRDYQRNNADVLFEQTGNKQGTKTNSSSSSSSSSISIDLPKEIRSIDIKDLPKDLCVVDKPPPPKRITLAPKISMTAEEAKELIQEFGRESCEYHKKVCSDHLVANGKTKKNAAAFMRNWIRKEIAERKGFYYPKQNQQNGYRPHTAASMAEKNLKYIEENYGKEEAKEMFTDVVEHSKNDGTIIVD